MVIAGFQISNSVGCTHWFEETFFIIDILQPLGLGMSFLQLGNLDTNWKDRTLY